MERVQSVWRRWGPWLLLALLAASLVPILLLGRYDWPTADDYNYAYLPHEALLQGGNFWGEVWHTMWGYYKSWQGTFTALALMALTPLTFSEFLYWLTPVVTAGALCMGTYKLTDTLVRRGLGGTWRQTVFVAVPILLLSIQCVASPKDTFYWWNGAVYYTFTYGIMLLLVERLAALKLARTRRQMLWAALPAVPAALLVGGSNYVSALLATLLCGLFLVYFLVWERSKLLPALPAAFTLAAAFAVSFLAPGNQGRQDTITEPMSPAAAVLASILKAGKDCLDWPNWPIVLVFLLMVPAVWGLTARTDFRFRWPAAFSVGSFLLFAAQNAPHFYAVSTSGPERLRSIVYYSFFWLVLCNLWYWLGWLRRAVLPRTAEGQARLRRGWVLVPVLLAALAVTGLWFQYPVGFTSVEAASALADGSARAYWEQQAARLEVLKNPGVSDVAFAPITGCPALLDNGDITTDPAHWRNNLMRVYYHKNSVTLID